MSSTDPVAVLRKALDYGGDRGIAAAIPAFVPLLDDEVRRLVRLEMGRKDREVTFQPTALVDATGLRFAELQGTKCRPHFIAIAASVVRRVLVETARTRVSLAQVDATPLDVSDEACISIEWSKDLIALDDALTGLAVREPRQSQVVELRFFGGLNDSADVVDVMIVAPAVVKHAWHLARRALVHELGRMERWVKK